MDLPGFRTISIKFNIGICLVLAFADCEMIANNTFTVNQNAPLGQGLWKASASCNTYFPTITCDPNGAWMVSRFGVPILSYQDYLGGNSIEMGPDNKSVISIIGYGGVDSLTYDLEFEYDVWIGSENPSGDCYQFTVYQEAKDFADTMDLLYDPPADTLIATADFSMVTSSAGLCQFSFPGITFGEQEGLILVFFTVPIVYQGDYIGNTILHTADDHTWYIVEIAYSMENSIDYNVNFDFETSDNDVSNATCSLYVSFDDAVAASLQLGATTPPQTTTGATPGVTSGVSTTSTVPMTTAGVPHVPNSNISSDYLYESRDMRNKFVQTGQLWTGQVQSIVQCARLCLADDTCISIFYHEASSECTAHSSVYDSGVSKSGSVYYVVEP